ncbi:uncharacterized protein LOC128171011 [Crassostrea angulata]|uniref:uncharacterized protein LOC128171011 n=1 Tax=Magallana angulata TaxID=2784310 RepID=UPI0022B125C6|nr:uncharacterized protein LOC128171011 [Crassostrea angulata]
MDTSSSIYSTHKCSKCPGDTEYHCVSCPCDLCPQCKENHVKDLQTIDHDVVSHRDKINYIPTQEICVRHPSHVYTKYCEPCQVPCCNNCQQHRKHKKIDVKTTYKTKRQQLRGTIHTIRSDALFYRPVLLPRITDDIKTCHTEFSLYQSAMLPKAQTLKHLINKVRKDFKYNVFCDFDFKHRCLKQMIEMSRHIVSLQEYELRYVQPAFTFSALQFLSFTKTALPQIHLTLHTSQLSMTESLNKEDVMESLSAIQITERGNRRIGNQCLLKLTSGAEFHQSLTVTGVDCCHHISCVTSDRVWVNGDKKNLMLTDTTGVPLHRVEDSCSNLYGLHTVNSESELIYRDRNYNINKLSKDMKTTTTFIEGTDSTWIPRCVYWSPSTGDLLVGMYNYRTETGKVTRYNQSGQLTQTKKKNNTTGQRLYRYPNYITENNNGDVVVSDSSAVVVTECGGRHRFSYTGHPSGSGLRPRGICTDPLSHILVCDYTTETVQMIDRDGQFLSHLLIRPSGIFRPWGLSYDVNTHRLWVGSASNNTVVIYRYITRQDALTDLNPATADVMESLSEIPTTWTEKPQQGNQCLLKLMSPPELLPSLTVTGVYECYHISCVTSDRVWVSDRNNLMLTDTTGVPLHRVEDSCRGNGLHTVNCESELIYIDRNYNINKLSKDMKTTTTFIERIDYTWEPWCVYWSPSTGDLLVGMYNDDTETGKVTRYNQSGQLKQTIQNDTTGLGLYRKPNYITENNNGDVVVSDSSAVVVTECGGRNRFSYTGHPSGSGLRPRGICTDPLSHILVCDYTTETVQMIDRDGQFLSHLLIRPSGIFRPWSLSYDVNTHRLWVGSRDNNTVVIYRYITRQDALTDLNPATADVMESLSEIPTTGTEKPQQGNQCLLKLMSPPELLPSLTVTGVDGCCHISCVTSDRVWVSDRNNLMLTDTTGVPLHRVEDSCRGYNRGIHTVNSESELIYIDKKYNINKLSNHMKTTTTFIERTDSTWRPWCVYWSPSTGDLLVGMYNYDTKTYKVTGKVTRYNQRGQLTQTIQNDNTGRGLYGVPRYITENNNGDVVVSDDESAVVVTERGGRHRFSYTGHPSGSGLEPRGICTDPLSHILVCDYITDTVQMIDSDGQFLSHLLIRPSGIFYPCSLSYDVNTHRLWVGSRYNNTVVIYRYITRQDALTDLNPATADVMESLSEIPTTGTEKPQQGKQCLLKLMSPPKLLHSLTVTGVGHCVHISCVTSDRVWVSDDWGNLMLTNTTGVPLHRVEDSCRGYGLHTVNSESELIYIDRNSNINKLSKDMKTTTTFIERTDSTWRPQCVYWSPSTGDLLVGMYNDDTKTAKVTRYNQSGRLTQTIQNDNTGLGLYREPNYITENNNGDVVVSDCFSAVVVTERGGRHRFSYTGHPSGSGLEPRGICTDPLSHILVCDGTTETVQMIDRNGQFLSQLLIEPSGIFSPWSLSYDVNTHRLWVGSYDNNTVVIYRYITRQDALTDLNPATADVMESLSGIPTTGTEKPQQGNQCLLKLMSPPELLHSLRVTGVDRCYHISCVTSDRVWVSYINRIILTDTTGVPLHRVEDSWSGDRGSHTVKSENELIYIDRNSNINKLSKDMKTTTTFIERTDTTWRPWCVYWSPSTGDLLVGMYRKITEYSGTGKVTRYNQSGQLTQTIQHDNTGLGLYREPNYITENNNGDVVVSDSLSAVVVTERGVRHRFSYTGHPSGSGLQPRGICTDPLSHILVCDGRTKTVQMLDRDGQFLSHLLIRPSGILRPYSLSYDVNTHRLWVGSLINNKVVIYRYITRQDALTDLNPATADVMESLSEIPTTGTEKPQQGNQCLLKLMSPPELLHSLTVTGVDRCLHFSCVTPDRFWVSDDKNNLMLTDTTGVPLHRVEDSCSDLYGSHTVNSESELIYIDRKDNINKLSKDMKTTTTFIERTDSTWEPRCVYWSPSTGDLLVGMYNIDTETAKVTRYNQSGQLTQTIQNDNTGLGLYIKPHYITENNNGDVVVSDFRHMSGAVVVTERGGRHRFSYTGDPSGSRLSPSGICTDALSHILVCDDITHTVQMIDRDGQFLSHLLISPSGIFSPRSLSYDVNTHRLWVGSWYNKTVVIYRYITRQDALTDLNPATADVMESLSEIPTTGTEKPQQGNQCLLKLMSPPELLPSLTVTGVVRCDHISCVTSDRVWVSDRYNLMLTDTTGVPLHRVQDSCSDYFYGLHTVNSESELIYIDRNYDINKMSKDMKTTTTFIERTDSTWEPRCVYWSPSTGDLLVGMYNYDTKTGKVTRYNHSGQLTQTIQYHNTGLGLYSKPNYITENNNGDVVVSDWSDAVVVTERGGRYRFSYTGHPSGSGLVPRGICTDPLSHILVCDVTTDTVQMLDSDGQFLSHLLIRPSGIFRPRSLSYDVNTHHLWVGSRDNNTVVIYRYITRQDALTDLNPATADVMESLSEIPTTGTEKPQQGNQCLLKLMSPPELLPSLTVTGVVRCDHISCVTSDRVWVSHWDDLMLTDTTGVPLHRVQDSCSDYFYGLHTVNSESELIYIDRNYNINKLSKDMKTTTSFIERTDSTWGPRCVYWSPSTGDLLVGMYIYRTKTGKVTRYNQSGQLTQTIQYHNTGLGLYSKPNYITENNNGDVVVSDWSDAVVVTERGGRYRFSYTGHPSGSGLVPHGICTDALSHILVCDDRTETVQMIDRDGQFLSHLLIRPSGIFRPRSLSYDVNTHHLWVGSRDNNTVVIYRYITRQDALTDEHTPRPDEDIMSSSTPAV